MEAKTLRISSAHWSQALELSSGAVLLVSNQNAPHRYCKNMEDAQTVAQWTGTPLPWSESNPAKADDGWSNMVSIKGDILASMVELSRKTYDEPEAQAAAKADELAEINRLDLENARMKNAQHKREEAAALASNAPTERNEPQSFDEPEETDSPPGPAPEL